MKRIFSIEEKMSVPVGTEVSGIRKLIAQRIFIHKSSCIINMERDAKAGEKGKE